MSKARKTRARSTTRRSLAAVATPTLFTVSGPPLDLTRGVIVVLSGGPVDEMNPKKVRDRMDLLITQVNADPFVISATGGVGLRFKFLPAQPHAHIHQAKWRPLATALHAFNPTCIILVGHSNGGAAAMNVARSLQAQGRAVDLLLSCDSVLTLDDIGDINVVPDNVTINVNTYVIPTPEWLLAPFPIGRRNRRQAGDPVSGLLNLGLEYHLPGALAHRNAFYEIAGGDKKGGAFEYPNFLLDTTLAVLRGATASDVAQAAEPPLQLLANGAKVKIAMQSTSVNKTLVPVKKAKKKSTKPK
jgi:pimeloyl-ACP methyl ester carboxylesterase